MRRIFLLALLSPVPWCCAETLELKATPGTVVWGHYSASSKPALRIRSGDTVRIETVSTGSPARFEASGVAPDQISPALRQPPCRATPALRLLVGLCFRHVGNRYLRFDPRAPGHRMRS